MPGITQAQTTVNQQQQTALEQATFDVSIDGVATVALNAVGDGYNVGDTIIGSTIGGTDGVNVLLCLLHTRPKQHG